MRAVHDLHNLRDTIGAIGRIGKQRLNHVTSLGFSAGRYRQAVNRPHNNDMKRSKSTEKPEPPPPPPRQPWLSWIAGVLTLGLLLTGLGARINARTTLLEELGTVQRQKVVIHAKEPPDWLLENKLEQNIAAALRDSEDGPATAIPLDSHTPIEIVGKTIERAWWIDSFEVRRNLGRIEAKVVYRKPLLWVDVDPQQKLGFYLDRLVSSFPPTGSIRTFWKMTP